MHCPNCGSPVRIYGSQWECGWCGNYGGFLRVPARKPEPEPEPEPIPDTLQLPLTLSFSYQVDLAETWSKLKKALDQAAPGNALLSQLLGKLLLHHISIGIRKAGALSDEKKAEELRAFLNDADDLNLGEGAEEIMCAAQQRVLFCEEAALSETDCGTFWAELLSLQPTEDYYNRIQPDGLEDLFFGLSSAYAYFGGKKDEEMDEAQRYQFALQETYDIRRQNKAVLHPDAERAKRLLAHGKFPDSEDICREILLVEYPEEVPHETAEDFDELSWERILDDVFADSTAKGIEMWRRLLDIAGPTLHADPKTARKLLPDWDWLESPSRDQALPLLLALEDKRFLSQLFESASIGRLQLAVLDACRDCGQEKLGKHCLELAVKNPYLEENWEKRFRRVFTTPPRPARPDPRSYAASKPIAAMKPHDDPLYHYCSVLIQGMHRLYAYLTGGLPLKVGDWVEVPFGKDDVLRQGQVKSVMDCTRRVAPWPPELTKTVLRIIDAPPAPQAAKASPALPLQNAGADQPEAGAAAAASEPAASAEPAAEKKPFPAKKVIAAVLAAVVLIGSPISLMLYSRQRAAAYEAALQSMSAGDYASARRSFSKLSRYRDAAPLSVYCKYAHIYTVRTDYAGGQDELERITLQYDTGWQQDVDALEALVKGYKAEKDAAEERAAAEAAAKREQKLRKQYAGKLPVEGMPMSCLKYTSLGAPDEEEKCLNFDYLVEDRRFITVRWYGRSGEVLAAGTCDQKKGDQEFMLRSFRYYGSSTSTSAGSGGQPSYSGGGGSHSGSIRDDYDSPEDLWEDNRDWFEDEDEAWDEWYDD